MRKARPSSVFVPYEKLTSGLVVRVRDLPRFVEPHQVIEFLQNHRNDLSRRLLDWREEFDADSINEYMSGVGEILRPLPELIQVIERKH